MGAPSVAKRRTVRINDEANELRLVAYYGRPTESPEMARACFYTEADFEEFEADANRKPKKRAAGGRRRARPKTAPQAGSEDVSLDEIYGARRSSIFDFDFYSDDDEPLILPMCPMVENRPTQHAASALTTKQQQQQQMQPLAPPPVYGKGHARPHRPADPHAAAAAAAAARALGLSLRPSAPPSTASALASHSSLDPVFDQALEQSLDPALVKTAVRTCPAQLRPTPRPQSRPPTRVATPTPTRMALTLTRIVICHPYLLTLTLTHPRPRPHPPSPSPSPSRRRPTRAPRGEHERR